jgi:hypothetical protein
MKIAQFSSFGKPDEVIDCLDVNDLGDPNDNEVLIDVISMSYKSSRCFKY